MNHLLAAKFMNLWHLNFNRETYDVIVNEFCPQNSPRNSYLAVMVKLLCLGNI